MSHFLKKLSRILITGVLLVGGAWFTNAASAQTPPEPIQINVPIPGAGLEAVAEGAVRGVVPGLTAYIGLVYNFLISIVGLVAGTMIMIGGYQYLTAGGDAARVGAAKTRIGNAVIGLVLALGSFLLLNTINPDLVTFKPLDIKPVKTELITHPWCEDLEKEGATVTQITKHTNVSGAFCGDIGEYKPTLKQGDKIKQGESAYCIYRGKEPFKTAYTDDEIKKAKGIGAEQRMAQLCMQGAWNVQKLAEEARKIKSGGKQDPKVFFATPIACQYLSPDSPKFSLLGFTVLNDSVCDSWWQQAKQITDSLPADKNKRVAYCDYYSEGRSCFEILIDCKDSSLDYSGTYNAPKSCKKACPLGYSDKGKEGGAASKYCYTPHTPYSGRPLPETASQCDKDYYKGAECEGYMEAPYPVWTENGKVVSASKSSLAAKIPLIGRLWKKTDRDLKDWVGALNGTCTANLCGFNLDRGGCSYSGDTALWISRGTGTCANK